LSQWTAGEFSRNTRAMDDAASTVTAPLRATSFLPPARRGFHEFWLPILRPAYRRMFGMAAHGLGNLPRQGPFILAPNHVSMMDWSFLSYYFPGHVRFVVHREYFDHPLLGIAMRFNGAVPLRTDRPDLRAVRQALAVLAAGEPLVFFPEGGISRSGRPGRGHPGVIALASRARARIVPAAIAGARDVLPRDRWLPRRGQVRVTFGRALPPPPEVPRREQRQLAQRLMTHVAQLLDGVPDPPLPW